MLEFIQPFRITTVFLLHLLKKTPVAKTYYTTNKKQVVIPLPSWCFPVYHAFKKGNLLPVIIGYRDQVRSNFRT